ncbi:hypothetical protein L873DRAFT_1839195 [Choiromyces venosus 120613-1]|uniref:Uncharacterized protein n=1 Tax=Choiromyces venosus 120613-1 TaxID=1336337 RepID=A0A3N4IZI7_9PEZI|nr:hypothetical protein L873DRAFT_1839195 [Choiromyces venosus 120613-1]
MVTIATTILSLTLSLANAHMLLKNPPSLGFTGNKLATKPDSDLNAPISKAQFRGAGKSVATWPAGSNQAFSLAGGATHGGGSCQVSLSYDNGETFKVIKSFIGNCPSGSERDYSFSLGNREMYMGCAAVTITNGGSGLGTSYPKVFVANIENGCQTAAEGVLEFPNPGGVVERSSEPAFKPVGAGCV